MTRVAAIVLCVLLLMPAAIHHRPLPIKPRDAFTPSPFNPARESALEEFEDTEGRNNWFTYQRAYPFETIPADARRRAFEALSRMRAQSLVHIEAARRWQPIGPAPTFSAYMANWGNTSGRINAIAVSPADSRIVILGSATGGIWRSTDGGASFAAVSDDQVDLAVGSLAFARSNPAIVYAGMGDSKSGYLGSGVLKSTDAGQTWARVSNATLPTPGTTARIEVDPTNASRVYVAQYSRLATDKVTSGGLYVSNDGGINWTKMLEGAARDIVINPADRRILFGGFARLDADNDPPMRVVQSTDAGATWAVSFTGSDLDVKMRQDCRVAISPVDPQRVYAYYGGFAGNNLVANLRVSINGGATWTDLGAQGFDTGQLGYNTYLAADPNDAKTLYLGSRDVYRSTDGGATWANLTRTFTFNGDYYDYSPGISKAHADQHALCFVPNRAGEFYIGCDGGVYKTSNNGATFDSLNRGLTLTQFTSIAIHPNDASVSLGGTQDNGTQRRNGQNSAWYEVASGDGGRVVFNPLDPNVTFLTYIRGNIFRYYGSGLYFDQQVAFTTSFGENDSPPRVAFYPPLVSNGVDARLYFGTWRLFINEDLGWTWTAPAGDLDLTKGINDKGRDVLTAIGVARANTNVIYTGSAQGRAMASTDSGATWRDITGALPNRSITNIKVDPANSSLAYLTMSGFNAGHVFKTTDGGASWQNSTGNLPDVPANTILIDPLDAGVIYVGTDIGVFRSTGGANWQSFNNGLPPVVVTELAAHPGGLIQAATYGRGAFEMTAPAVPKITSINWNGTKAMAIEGAAFNSGARVTINDADRTDYVRSLSEAVIRLKGKGRALGLKTGDNTIRVTNSDGVASNTFTLRIE
ncbi:MAG: WD40/YVTN/BNR-like repeat-containing protein [Blastocatellia bacterium]